MDAPKPIGYWLKHLHNLLEKHFAITLADLDADRRQWQLLNSLSAAPRTPADLDRALDPFWNADADGPQRTRAQLIARGWIKESDGTIALTPDGTAAHAELARRINHTRAVLLQGLTPQQYAETVRVLSVMAANLDAANLEAAAAGPTG